MSELTQSERLILDAWKRGGPREALMRTGVTAERIGEVLGKATEFGHISPPFPSREEWEKLWAGT